MSYILTALKKSQQQRDRGAVPTLSSAAAPPSAPKRRQWPLLLIGGLALNVTAFALLAWWLGEPLSFGESTAEEVIRPAPSAPSEPQIASNEPSIEVGPPRSLPPAPKPDADANHLSKTRDSAAPQPEVQAESVAETSQPAVPNGRAEAGPGANSSHQKASASSAPMPSIGIKPRQDLLAIAEPQDVDQPPAPKETHDEANVATGPQMARLPAMEPPPLESAEPTLDQSPETKPDTYASLPMLHSLSYTIQTKLPDLSILVHVYGEEPGDRFVIIQNRKYREGDELADDLAVEAITPSGAVLRYKDTTFRIEP